MHEFFVFTQRRKGHKDFFWPLIHEFFFLVKIENVDLEIENTNIRVNTENTIHTSEF